MILLDRDKDVRRLKEEYGRRRQDAAYHCKYSIFNPGQLFMLQSRQRNLLEALNQTGITDLADKSILEVGCGGGGVLREMLALGADPGLLYGVELLPYRCVDAKRNLPWASITQADGRFLPFESSRFDLLLQFTMFTSILDAAVKQCIAEEMLRVLRPDGVIVWYDFWLNPTNPQTKGIRLSEIRNLFPGCTVLAQKITLAPPIVSRLIRFSRLFCEILEAIKIFNTHYLALIKKINKT